MWIQKCVERQHELWIHHHIQEAADISEHFKAVERDWPQVVTLDTKFNCSRQFCDDMKWTKSKTCAVCSRDLQCGEPLKSHSYVEEDLDDLLDRLHFDLLWIRDGVHDVNPVDHSLLSSYMLDTKGWIDRLLTVCTQCETWLENNFLSKYALCNQLFRGLLPEEFHDLTWVKEMVCSVYCCTIQMTCSLEHPSLLLIKPMNKEMW